jgi:hypothetical protein
LTQAQFEQNFKRVGEFVAFIFCGGLCIAFYVNFKTYHASLEKLEKLSDLFNNPKARVASGEQGQRIMKRLQQAKTPKVEEKPAQVSELNETLKKVADLLAAQQQPALKPVAKKLQQAAPGYQPPQFPETQMAFNTPSYQLQEPILGSEPLLGGYPKLTTQLHLGQFGGYPQIQMQRQAPISQMAYPQLLQPQMAQYQMLQQPMMFQPAP